MRLGVFGGTFNPVHYGHLRAAEEVREKVGIDRVLFVPAGNPPLKSSELVDIKYRYSMVQLAVSHNKFFDVSDIECRGPERSYSVDTVQRLRDMYPEAEHFFILGIDAFMDLPHWREPEKLTSLVDFVIINRPPHTFTDIIASPYIEGDAFGEPVQDGLYRATLKSGRTALFLDITPLAISATGIRNLVREGKSIKYLLPENVESFIMSNGLYVG